MDEFKLIEKYFSPLENSNNEVVIGNGDDAAIVNIPVGKSLALSIDTLVEGVHFLHGASAQMVGYRAAAVNLSDMAAMAAEPRYALLSLTIPEDNERWLKGFSLGLGECLSEYGCSLIGGDTTRGPLTISLTMAGFTSQHRLARSGAQVGDYVLVSGTLGDARGALDILKSKCLNTDEEFLIKRYERPSARITLSSGLAALANSAIDVSDGLLADASHIAIASNVGMELILNELPVSSSLKKIYGEAKAIEYALTGGDDYEVIYTIPESSLDEAYCVATREGACLTQIGIITKGDKVKCLSKDTEEVVPVDKGYHHF